MARKQPTDEQLVKNSHHVAYEMEQLADAVGALAANEVQGEPLPDVISNALLESVVMHARGLIEFATATPKSAQPDDVIAKDYVPGWNPELSDFLKEVKTRADKEMMHITQGRSIAEEARRWKYGKIFNQMSALLVPFILNVPDEKVRDDFPKRARDAFPEARGAERKTFTSPRPMAYDEQHSVPTRSLAPEEREN